MLIHEPVGRPALAVRLLLPFVLLGATTCGNLRGASPLVGPSPERTQPPSSVERQSHREVFPDFGVTLDVPRERESARISGAEAIRLADEEAGVQARRIVASFARFTGFGHADSLRAWGVTFVDACIVPRGRAGSSPGDWRLGDLHVIIDADNGEFIAAFAETLPR